MDGPSGGGAGVLPYVTLIAGALTVYLGSQLDTYHVPWGG